MARPTKLPEWASSGIYITEPSEPKKDAGWTNGERPPANWMNWLFNNIYLWIVQFVLELDALALLIGTEISNRVSAITTEQGVRSSADAALRSDIDDVAGDLANEISSRSGGDSALGNRLDEYDGDTAETSGIMVLTGFASNLNVNFYAQFHRHRASTQMLVEVLLYVPLVTGTSNDPTMALNGADIPAALRPDTEEWVPIMIVDNGVQMVGRLQLTTSTNWYIRKYDGASVTATGTKGICAQTIRYKKEMASI
jgi:hypothetical protein